jgi:hypothetical protein
MAGFVRRRADIRLAPELAIGAFVAWLAITETFVHDTRYSMPLLVYLAIFGVCWITSLPQVGRLAALALLILAVAFNTAGASFGAGRLVQLRLAATNAGFPDTLTILNNGGFLVAAPRRDGDLLATLRALKQRGVVMLLIEPSTLANPEFSGWGIRALGEVAGVETYLAARALLDSSLSYAALFNGPLEEAKAPPCVKLANGTGVWIILGNPAAHGARYFCPTHRPQLYQE